MQDGKRDFEKNCVENEKLNIDFYKGPQVIFPDKVGREFDIEKQYSKWWYLGVRISAPMNNAKYITILVMS